VPARQFFRQGWPWLAAIAVGIALALLPHAISRLTSAGPPASLAVTLQDVAWISDAGPSAAALELVTALREAPDHGLDPARYRVDQIEARLARLEPSLRAETEQMLSAALVLYASDLRVPQSRAEVTYVDPELQPRPPDMEALLAFGSPAEALRSLQRRNVIYEGLRAGLARYRSQWSELPQITLPHGPTLTAGSRGERVALLRQRLGADVAGADSQHFDAQLGQAVQEFREAHGLAPLPIADRETIDALNAGAVHFEQIIIANMDRVRGLPLDGSRYVLVDTAGAELRLIENGRQVDAMRAVVGAPGTETPKLAGFIRFAVVNPYWNVPPDLVRQSIAPQVLRQGRGALARRNLALFPDWQSTMRLDPQEVDWAAVAQGREDVWVRQLPGGDNMMGDVKFMLPNSLGIYLHDTPRKSDFRRTDRRLSSGCVRVEDADRLARWLFQGRQIMTGDPTPEKRIDVPDLVPVFITYLTAVPEGGGIRFRPDVEQRDGPLLARLAAVV
jgi:L,D-transpeptidase YcbB